MRYYQQKCKCSASSIVWFLADISTRDENEFRMEEEMARVVAQNETLEAEKKALARKLEILQNNYVHPTQSIPVNRYTER